MSKLIVSQKIKQTCEGCGVEKTSEVAGLDMESEAKLLAEMQEWYVVGRKIIFNGQLTSISADACCLACVPAAAVKLALPPQEPAAGDGIDLASLRVGGPVQ